MPYRRAPSHPDGGHITPEGTPHEATHSEISIQLEEILTADPAICRPSRSPCSSHSLGIEKGCDFMACSGLQSLWEGRSPVPEYLQRLTSFSFPVPRARRELPRCIGATRRTCVSLSPVAKWQSVELERSRRYANPCPSLPLKGVKSAIWRQAQAQQGWQQACSWLPYPNPSIESG